MLFLFIFRLLRRLFLVFVQLLQNGRFFLRLFPFLGFYRFCKVGNPLLFSRATTGPFCMRGACKEGKMGCKNPMPYLTPSELLRLEFPLLYEEGGAGNAG